MYIGRYRVVQHSSGEHRLQESAAHDGFELFGLDSRELVLRAMRGDAARIPVFWLSNPDIEASVGDVVSVRCYFKPLAFLEKDEGGPFKRGTKTRREWSDTIRPDQYDWPSLESLLAEMDQVVDDTLKVNRSKSLQLQILGPTEYSEFSCCPPRGPEAKRLDQVSHLFDFAVLTMLDPKKADIIHEKFFNLVMDIAKRATEYEMIDSIRIADDFCGYSGSLYRLDFTETLVNRLVELGRAILARGKFSVLHADGDIRKYLPALSRAFSGFHPLDIKPKATLVDAHHWAAGLAEVRHILPETVFFTGIPVDLLCNRKVSAGDLLQVTRHAIESVGSKHLVLTTTHRPYPGWSFGDFKEKVDAINEFVESMTRTPI